VAAEPIDPAWPPVLTAVVLAVAVGAVVVAFVFLRRARATLREQRSPRE